MSNLCSSVVKNLRFTIYIFLLIKVKYFSSFYRKIVTFESSERWATFLRKKTLSQVQNSRLVFIQLQIKSLQRLWTLLKSSLENGKIIVWHLCVTLEKVIKTSVVVKAHGKKKRKKTGSNFFQTWWKKIVKIYIDLNNWYYYNITDK